MGKFAIFTISCFAIAGYFLGPPDWLIYAIACVSFAMCLMSFWHLLSSEQITNMRVTAIEHDIRVLQRLHMRLQEERSRPDEGEDEGYRFNWPRDDDPQVG